jgi:hypothetical protein
LDVKRASVFVALTIAVTFSVVGVRKGTWSAGGSDSSCYALMADAFARGALQPTSSLSSTAPWPQAPLTLAPAGFIPSPVRIDGASPVCAPGYSVLLTPLVVVGGREALFLGTPLAGALLIWFTFIFARALAGTAAGLAAAVVIATTPIVLFQVVQPMNDITTAMTWMAVLAAATVSSRLRPWLIGAATGVAILVRPNLAPAAVVAGVWLLLDQQPWSNRIRNALYFSLAAAPSLAVALLLNATLYGHPLRVGYGVVDDLFSVTYVLPNLQRYGNAIVQTTFAIPLLGLIGPLMFGDQQRRLAGLAIGIAGAITGVYLLYRSFEEWWYLRFLMPAIVPMTAVAIAAAFEFADRKLPRANHSAMSAFGLIVVALIAVAGVKVASERQAFDLQRLEARFWRTGQVVRDRIPSNALAIAVWQSGTIRFHAGREAVLWDSLAPEWLDQAIAWLRSRGYDPHIVVERWEEPLFRQRFGGHSAVGNLDWPPRFDVDRQVRIFRPSDRDNYLRGEHIPTEHIIPRQ